ncbi:MAG: hypothetical protein E7211_21340 [Clostridium lundense]|jgi:hypothetical protein|nr:hypothetical protein [Clostridium lundense]
MSNPYNWKTDNYKLVGKSFDFAYQNRLNKMLSIIGSVNSSSIDYELTGSGGYGEMPVYDGSNLNEGDKKRGFKTVITPEEFSLSEAVGYKQAKVDKSGECGRVGKLLGNSAAMTVYMHALRMLAGAFDATKTGGDGKSWAATDHPIASKGAQGRRYIPDPDAGTYSNLIAKTLSVSAITDAQALAGRFVTPDGLPFLADMSLLLVSPELEAEAKKICGDNGKYRPERNPADAGNAANPLADLQYMVIGGGNDGFSKKQWAICDPALMREMVKLVYITKPTVMQTALDNPLKDLYTGYVDFGIGWGDARPIIFSNPS